MVKFVSAFTALLFCIWLLPLGVFIKPSQEKTACGGQRAICMCSHSAAKAKKINIAGYGFKNQANEKESNPSSGGAGHYYVTAQVAMHQHLALGPSNDRMLFSYRNPSILAIEHVPKA